MKRDLVTILAKVIAAETMRARSARVSRGENPGAPLDPEVAKIASRESPGRAVFDKAHRDGLVTIGKNGSELTDKGRALWDARGGGAK